ncbi:MAG: class I SAM-dependent methyltransferase [Deltaproteobacteria bacterium]|nr:class I SAM-dependent methyltransferase [Deltaproteobacteria bacterium]
MDLAERPETTLRRHPWEVARARFFLDRLPASPGRVLDVGAGDAYLANRLVQEHASAEVVCQDLLYTDQDLASLAAQTSASIQFCRDLPEGPFDTILLLDVLEHVPDDLDFMRELMPRLAPEGRLVFSIPAWPMLFSSHDRSLAHHRRYTPADAKRVLTQSGLVPLASGGLFHSLLAPRALQVGVERLTGRKGRAHDLGWRAGPLISRLVDTALTLDTRLSGLLSRSPLEAPGLSWWAVCGRSSADG